MSTSRTSTTNQRNDSLPRDAWYLALASSRLADAPVAVTLFGEPLVLFRDANGAAVALQDRCPHRGVALSLGKVEQGRIACAYHGWQFGSDGRCAHIPSLVGGGSAPRGALSQAYPCVEQDGQIWVWMGPDTPSLEPLAIPGFADFSWQQGSIDLACDAILPIENNLDICHPVFVHPRLHAQWFIVQERGFQEVVYEMTQRSDGVETSIGNTTLRFDLPDRITISAGEPPHFLMILFHVPLGEASCRQHWLLRGEPVSEQQPFEIRWVGEEPAILAQDRLVLESAQRTHDRWGRDFEVSVEADAPTLAARRLLRAAVAGRPAEGRTTRMVRVRS